MSCQRRRFSKQSCLSPLEITRISVNVYVCRNGTSWYAHKTTFCFLSFFQNFRQSPESPFFFTRVPFPEGHEFYKSNVIFSSFWQWDWDGRILTLCLTSYLVTFKWQDFVVFTGRPEAVIFPASWCVAYQASFWQARRAHVCGGIIQWADSYTRKGLFLYTTGSNAYPNHAAWPLLNKISTTKKELNIDSWLYEKPEQLTCTEKPRAQNKDLTECKKMTWYSLKMLAQEDGWVGGRGSGNGERQQEN